MKTSSDGYDFGFLFGKTAITAPPTGCTDAFVYWVSNGYSILNGVNSAEVGLRGTEIDGYQTQAFYYNGCTKDVGIAMSLTTQYPQAINDSTAGKEFSARFELFGNSATKTFQLRTLKFDLFGTDTGIFSSITAAGVAAAGGNLALALTSYNCPTSACDSPTATAAGTRNYCIELGTTSGTAGVDATTANCSAYEADFEDAALAPFATGASTVLSRSVLDFSLDATFGL